MEAITIAAIIVFALLLSLLGRTVREPLMEVVSPLSPADAFSALQRSVVRTGWGILRSDEAGRSIVLRAKLRLVAVLYQTWGDQVTITVEAIPDSTKSRVQATCRLARATFYVKKSDPEHMDGRRLRQLLVESTQGEVVKESPHIP